MKNILMLLWISAILVSCNQSPEQALKISENGPVPAFEVNYFPTLATSQSRMAVENLVKTGALSGLERNCRNEVAQKVFGVQELQLGSGRARSADERQMFHKAYKGFITKYGSDTMLTSSFRDQYATVFLKEHDPNNARNADDFAFYTNELIESHMGNYELITNCMENLKGKIHHAAFVRMRQNVATQMQQSVINEGKLRIAMSDMVRQKETELRRLESESIKGQKRPPKRVMLSVMRNYNSSDRDEILQRCLTRIRQL